MAASQTSRRLRWALLIALALHLLLAWRYAPQLRARVEQALAPAETVEKVVEITPEAPSPEPPRERWALQTSLGGRSPEALPPPLPEGFFPKPAPAGAGRLELSGALGQAPSSAPDPAPTVAATAPVVPAIVRLPDIVAVSPQARTPRPTTRAQPRPAPPLNAVQVAPQPRQADPAPPLRLPPEEDPALDIAITRAAETAERGARREPSPRPPEDLRRLLPQGPIAQTPLRAPDGTRPASPLPEAGITTYPLDAPAAPDDTRAAPDEGTADQAPNRAQYFAQLTARLKATNQRALAESVKASPRVTVRMKFVVDRQGRLLEVRPAEGEPTALSARAAEIIRAAAPFPRVPEAMVQTRLELSFPVEVYR